MQPVAVISDIHANLPALKAVLAEIDGLGIERILCCGDIVGYGPHPRECVQLIRERSIPSVLGNHDLYTIQLSRNPAARDFEEELRANMVWAGILHAVDELRDEDMDWLMDLPTFLKRPGVIIGHAAMHDVASWPYLIDDEDIIATLDEMAFKEITLGFFGHSHDQQWCTRTAKGSVKCSRKSTSVLPANKPCAVVVGSVGQPRTGDPRAAWTLWNPETRSIEFRRTDYPIHETIKAIQSIGLPMEAGVRLLDGY